MITHPKHISAALVAAFLACGGRDNGDQSGDVVQPDTIAVTIMIAQPREFTVWQSYFGKLAPIVRAQLTSGNGGRVSAIYAEEGDLIEKGDALARINADEAINAFETAQLNNTIAAENLARAIRYRKDGIGSELDIKQARLVLLNSRAQMLTAARLRDDALAVSPIRGMVALRSIELQQQVGPGMPTFSIAKIDTVRISINIPESDVVHIDPGAPAQIMFAAFPQRTWSGYCRSISRDVQPQNHTYAAKVIVPNSDGMLRPGLSAHVLLAAQSLDSVFVAPNSAIVIEADSRYVMTVRNGKAVRKRVRVGPRDSVRTALTGGLAPSDTIIVKGARLAAQGAPVNIIEKRSAP